MTFHEGTLIKSPTVLPAELIVLSGAYLPTLKGTLLLLKGIEKGNRHQEHGSGLLPLAAGGSDLVPSEPRGRELLQHIKMFVVVGLRGYHQKS